VFFVLGAHPLHLVPDHLPTPAVAGLALLTSAAIALREELVFRAYLIPRLEALTARVPALLLASALFGVGHVAYSARAALGAFLSGLICGGAFLLFRRVWPGVVAHNLYDALIIVLRT
jgi:membrane protease YdiL (CAAX protease family)